MKTFLDQVSEEIIKNHPGDFSKACVVFPTRRAGLIFRNRFSRLISKPVFAPTVLSITDFIALNDSDTKIVDDLELLIELFSVYKKYFPGESFDTFFHWGQIMLNDFNEIDLQFVNAANLFSNIVELKRIENEFGLGEEEALMVSQFWKQFTIEDTSEIKKTFLKIWEVLPLIYTDFKNHLCAKKISYEGMAWQKMLEQLQQKRLTISFSKIYFAGFYAVPHVIEKIISLLQNRGNAVLLWDTDTYYIEDSSQEAGNYFRNKNNLYRQTTSASSHYSESPKNIFITGIPLQTGQAKLAGNFVAKLLEEKKIDEFNTAVVLPDESLLFPILYSLPKEVESFNVTMGYPFAASHAASFIDIIQLLHSNARRHEKASVIFNSNDVLALLEHPYTHALAADSAGLIVVEIKKNNIGRFGPQTFTDPALSWLFDYNGRPEKMLSYLRGIFVLLNESAIEKKISIVDSSIIRHLAGELTYLEKKLGVLFEEISAETAWQIARKILRSIKIPFSGEPVRGLQVMGFLETRALDFENVIICSVNESVLPAANRTVSFIPFSLRKGFGFPGIEEQDAVYAYHFYRLLQRAKNIYLLYDTEVKSLTGGEKSRYILQIAHEMKKKLGKKINLNFSLASTPVAATGEKIISVQKNDDIIAKLEKRFVAGNETGSGLSASAISSYIYCKLQFYFRYVLGIKEQKAIENTMEADVFGKVLHDSIQDLYDGKKLITPEIIDSLLKQVNDIVTTAINKTFPSTIDHMDGKIYLDRQVISHLIKKILDEDRKIVPFEIEMLEASLETMMKSESISKDVVLKGVFDRVHLKNMIYNIVDYKTGKDIVKNAPIEVSEIEELLSDHRKKAGMQLLFYALIFNKLFPGKNIRAGIYKMKNIESGIQFLNEGNTIAGSMLSEFEVHLKKLVDKIFDRATPFDQTNDVKKCENCPYNTICNR